MANVRYHYEVAGKAYVGTREAFYPPEQPSEPEAAHYAASTYPPGSKHDVFYNPDDPCDSVLLSNAVDLKNRDARESEYMQIIGRYTKEEANKFPIMLAELVTGLEAGMEDVLGQVYMEMELGNKDRGQVFTPYSLCQVSARMVFDKPHVESLIADKGYITMQEPAVGGGAMVIAFAETMHEAGINYQQHLHVTSMDVDIKAVCMAYVQFSLLHIPAIVIHGNTISQEEWSRWYTPAHILNGWSIRLRSKAQKPALIEPEAQIHQVTEELIITEEPVPIPIAAKKQTTIQLSLF